MTLSPPTGEEQPRADVHAITALAQPRHANSTRLNGTQAK